MIVAWIPARKGSRRLPHKNRKKIGSQSLVSLAVTQARAAGFFDEIFVDTDSSAIESDAIRAGAKSTGLRPNEVSRDTTSTADSLLSWLDRLPAGLAVREVFVLQPSSPLRSAADIAKFRGELSYSTNSAASCSLPWQPAEDLIEPVGKSWRTPFGAARPLSRRLLFLDGAIFYCKTEWFLKKEELVVAGETELIEISRLAGLDIDDEFQLRVARAISADQGA